jgi:nitrite reductase/ring-hydroxylating ferredoxin subunit
MPEPTATIVDRLDAVEGLARRVLAGEVVIVRRGLQQLGLYDKLAQSTLEGIRRSRGPEVAQQVERAGFDRIHEFVQPGDIPAVTDAVYEIVTANANEVLVKLVPGTFPGGGSYYFERSPNVRFHIPFDIAAAYRKQFDKFAQTHGQGKIAAHGPHRDPWVDCPDNVINVWIAIGPVRRGNGLTVFTQDYGTDFAFRDGYILPGAKLHQPINVELEPGDMVLFHSDHLHGSELNQTQSTRYVISYRVAFGKPHYPHGHYHFYQHVGLAKGPWRFFAGIPQNLQWSFVRYQFRRIGYKLAGRGRMSGSDSGRTAGEPAPELDVPGDGSIALADFPVGTIRPVSRTACIARLEEDRFAAVSRACPHAGGDLACGWIEDGRIVCPLHSLAFDPHTGASSCAALKALRTYPVEVRDGRVAVAPPTSADAATRETTATAPIGMR